MTLIRTAIKSTVYSFLMLFVILASLIIFFLTTTPGFYVAISAANYLLPGKLTLTGIHGQLMDQMTLETLTYTSPEFELTMNHAALHWHLQDLLHQRLTIKTLTADRVNLTLQNHHNDKPIEFPNIPVDIKVRQLLIKTLTITTSAMRHHLTALELRARLTPKQWDIGALTFTSQGHSIHFNGSAETIMPYSINAELQIHPLKKMNSCQWDANLTATGNIHHYQWHGVMKAPALLTLKGSFEEGGLLKTSANWSKFDLPINDNQHITLEKGQLSVNGTQKTISMAMNTVMTAPLITNLTMNAAFNEQQQRVDATVQLGPNQLKLTGGKAIPWTLSAQLPEPALLHPALKGLKTSIQANATLLNTDQGQLKLTVNKGSYELPNKAELAFLGGELNASLTPKGLNVESNFTIEPNKKIQLTLLLPRKNNKWQIKGALTANENTLSIDGMGDFSPIVKGAINLNSTNFLLLNSTEYLITMTPKLTVEFAPSLLKLRGNILIPKAEIKPQTFTDTINLTDDVVFVSEKKEFNPLNIDTDIVIQMGTDVHLSVKGLQGLLGGAIRLQQLPKGPLTATGQLDVRDGQYKAYGQDLIIDQGQLLFTGGVIDNPAIQVRAIRQFNNASNSFSGSNQLFDFNPTNIKSVDFASKTTVGIEVVGRLNSPKVQLFSIPSNLSQADILSLLLLGKPADQASKSGGQLLLTAVSALNLNSGGSGMQLLSQLKQKLGIDFNLENNAQYNQKNNQSSDNTAFVVGKALSKRLYLSYNMGLTQTDSNVLTLKYLLNKFFSLQVNASMNSSGIDLLYTHQKE